MRDDVAGPDGSGLSEGLGPNVENVMKVELTKEWCVNMAEREAAAGDPDCSAGAPARGLVERLRDSSGSHISGLYDRKAADEIERLTELADSEGTRAVAYLRRARKAEDLLSRFEPLRARGVVDADNNLDCWDTAPFELCAQHVDALNEKDPAAMWRVVELYAVDLGPNAMFSGLPAGSPE